MNGHTAVMKAPRYDLYAPDLYIPLLSMLTYCVMVAITKFLNGHFTADVMYSSVCTCPACCSLVVNQQFRWPLKKRL